MFKKLLVGFSLFLFSIIALAEPLKYPFKFDDLKNSLGADGCIELIVPKLDEMAYEKREYKAIPDHPDLVLARLHFLQNADIDSIRVIADYSVNHYVQFYSGYGILNKVSMVYDFSGATTNNIALEQMSATKKAFIENLKDEGFKNAKIVFGDMVKGDIRVSFSEVNDTKSPLLYVNITNDKVTQSYEDFKARTVKASSETIKKEVSTIFR